VARICAGNSGPGKRRGTAQAVPGRGRERGCSRVRKTAGRVQVAALLSPTVPLFVQRPVPTCVQAVVPDARIYDRAVVDDSSSGGHENENWRPVTIA